MDLLNGSYACERDAGKEWRPKRPCMILEHYYDPDSGICLQRAVAVANLSIFGARLATAVCCGGGNASKQADAVILPMSSSVN